MNWDIDPDVTTEVVDGEWLVLDAHQCLVMRVTGDAAAVLSVVMGGMPVPDRLHGAAEVLADAGVLAPVRDVAPAGEPSPVGDVAPAGEPSPMGHLVPAGVSRRRLLTGSVAGAAGAAGVGLMVVALPASAAAASSSEVAGGQGLPDVEPDDEIGELTDTAETPSSVTLTWSV